MSNKNLPKRAFYKTFDGRCYDLDDLSHQHLSNIYWFSKLFNTRSNTSSFSIEIINSKFNGKILSYLPNPKFKMEIEYLEKGNHLIWKKEEEFDVADIVYLGDVIGNLYPEGYIRNKKIQKIFDI